MCASESEVTIIVLLAHLVAFSLLNVYVSSYAVPTLPTVFAKPCVHMATGIHHTWEVVNSPDLLLPHTTPSAQPPFPLSPTLNSDEQKEQTGIDRVQAQIRWHVHFLRYNSSNSSSG